MKQVKKHIHGIRHFISRDIWHLDLRALSRSKAFSYRLIYLGYLVYNAIDRDRLFVRASALVYATLFAIVPFLAVLFALLKGFRSETKLETILYTFLKPLGDSALQIIVPQTMDFVKNANIGTLGTIGFFVVIFALLTIISNIESTFNDIWCVHCSRDIKRRIPKYISLAVMGPVFAITALTLTTSLQSDSFLYIVHEFYGFKKVLNHFLLLLLAWSAFYFLITFMPNTKVHARSGLAGAIIGGTTWHVGNLIFTNYIVASYQTGPKSIIYSGFAVVPLFLFWMYISWVIVLLAAEISYTHQNLPRLTWEKRAETFSNKFKEALALKILIKVAVHFQRGEKPPTSYELAEYFDVPEKLVHEISEFLVHEQVLYMVDSDESSYALAKSPGIVKLSSIIQALRTEGYNAQRERDPVSKRVVEFQNDVEKMTQRKIGQITLKDVLAKI